MNLYYLCLAFLTAVPFLLSRPGWSRCTSIPSGTRKRCS